LQKYENLGRGGKTATHDFRHRSERLCKKGVPRPFFLGTGEGKKSIISSRLPFGGRKGTKRLQKRHIDVGVGQRGMPDPPEAVRELRILEGKRREEKDPPLKKGGSLKNRIATEAKKKKRARYLSRELKHKRGGRGHNYSKEKKKRIIMPA